MSATWYIGNVCVSVVTRGNTISWSVENMDTGTKRSGRCERDMAYYIILNAANRLALERNNERN